MSAQAVNAATIIRAGVTYFVFVFGAGFILGSIRVPFLVPRFGERVAELIETPLMLVVVLIAARHVSRRHALPPHPFVRLGVGLVGLGLLLLAELALVVAIQRQSIGDYVSSKDPVAGVVFLVMLALFALMPLLLTRARWAGDRPVA